MDLLEARELAHNLMKQHGLEFWHFEFDNAKSRFGICRHSLRRIGLSRNLVLLNTKKRVTNTILHEIAHALVGPGNGHNWVWRQKAIEIGCNGKRCYAIEDTKIVKRTLIATCPNCGKEYGRFRITNKKYSCSTCSGGKFNDVYLLVYERSPALQQGKL
jgi:ribosomal protein S27AE